MTKPLVIPLFIPHEGCPHHCVFCNQHQISAQVGEPLDAQAVVATIHTWLAQARSGHTRMVQVAFYGGSFTGLAESRQRELLAAVQPFRQQGLVQEIRLSTRPDYIDAHRLALLHEYGVGTIELGVQSCDDHLLHLAGRGHSTADTIAACQMITAAGFTLGIQLLLGLPGETFAALRRTVHRPEFWLPRPDGEPSLRRGGAA